MTPDQLIEFINDEQNNAIAVRSARVVYNPESEHPINVVCHVEHQESGIRFDQLLTMSPIIALSLANALLIQSKLASPPPPSF
jgi:hypothetical protein